MSLKEFHLDKHTRLEWETFVFETLDQEALSRVYAGKDTAPIKEAKAVIKKAFKKLDELYAPKREKRTVDRAV